jgi:hypothetical protein
VATYVKESDTDPLGLWPEPRCDGDSRFDPEGFPLPADDGKPRRWVPLWGGSCITCGTRC